MAIGTNSLIQVSVAMDTLGSKVMNVWDFQVVVAPGTITAAQYGEAFWNHVKTNYRALAPIYLGGVFKSIKVLELDNPAGDYGEYAVPTAEQVGTRTNPSTGEMMPGFVAAGARITVPTRVTRPGQKRFPFVAEADANDALLIGGYKTALTNLMDLMTGGLILGAPAATATLALIVVGRNADGSVRDYQISNGYLLNDYVTSQVSRKRGRGI